MATCSGHCCQKFFLGLDMRGLRRQALEDGPESESRKIYDMVIPLTEDPVKDGYTCKHFVNGRCNDYENRPNMCRNFPYGKKCPFEKCTWDPNEAIVTTAKPGHKPIDLIKDPIALLEELLVRAKNQREVNEFKLNPGPFLGRYL